MPTLSQRQSRKRSPNCSADWGVQTDPGRRSTTEASPPSPDFDPHAAVYAKFASLVGELEPLRRRLKEVPLGLDHPYWVADADVDLDFHIRKVHLARPGMVDQLAELVSRLVGQPMDRSRPLWEVYVIDRL